MKVLIEAQETVAYSRVVEMDADTFKKYCEALDGSFKSNREAAEKIMGLYIDRRNDWQDDSEHEITHFDVFTDASIS